MLSLRASLGEQDRGTGQMPKMQKPLLEQAEIETEEWRTVREFPNYEVSNLGRVRRTTYITPYLQTGDEYLCVRIYDRNKRHERKVHGLVAAAGFIGPKPTPAHQVNHKDLNRTNARATNLEWMTQLENAQHSFREGHRLETVPRGEQHRLSKLHPHQIQCIRKFAAHTPWRQRSIGRSFGRISQHSIWMIVQRITWKHV
jgi:HNH endonuclease/NUMOD4 motif-containing protein